MDTHLIGAQLRKALELEGTLVHEHPTRVKEVCREIPHTIVLVDPDPDELPWASGAPCVPYALGFASHPDFWRVIQLTNIHPRRDFIRWLLDEGHLHELVAPVPGALDLYFAEGQWQHIGIITHHARVRSKWGTFPVYEHALWEVPSAYGHVVSYYRRPDPDDALNLFMQYASQRAE